MSDSKGIVEGVEVTMGEPGKVLEGVKPGIGGFVSGGLCDGCQNRKNLAYAAGLAGYTLCHDCTKRRKRTVAHEDSIVVGGPMWMADLHEGARQPCACVGMHCTRCMCLDELARRRPKVVVILGSSDNERGLVKLLKDAGLAGDIAMLGTAREPEDLNRRRIDMADEVIVANFDGKTCKAMRDDIEYAEMCGKPIRWVVAP